MLNLNSILLSSDSPEELSEFYAEVLLEGPGWEGGDFKGFKAGNSYLTIGPHSKVHGANANPERIIFNFETDDVTGEFERIEALDGAQVIEVPYSPGESPEMMLATFCDPDGNYFQLISPMQLKS